MSRAGYYDDNDDQWAHIMWRGSVASALRGKRGQAFLREMLAAMDGLPEKKLISGDLVKDDGCACALGTVALSRGIDVSHVEPEDYSAVAPIFGIADAMAREVMYENDEGYWSQKPGDETPEARFVRMRKWIVSKIGRWRVMVEGDL